MGRRLSHPSSGAGVAAGGLRHPLALPAQGPPPWQGLASNLAWTSLSRRADTMNQLVLCTLLLLALGELAGACPAGCQCQDPKTILCAARRGQTVPRGLPPNTLSLYVFENGITMLSEDSFAGLPALQLL
uniref:LRRNT domain-containing protein n=1 Tax=Bubo bubo TaxID=30461 RepID=A0A8C0FHZ8_BUBBB